MNDPSGLVPNMLELSCIDPFQPVCWAGVAGDGLTWAAAALGVGVVAHEVANNNYNMSVANGRTAAEDIQADLEYKTYKKVCENMPKDPRSTGKASFGDICKYLFELFTRHSTCAKLRQDWDNKWTGPRFPNVKSHSVEITKNISVVNWALQQAIKKNCPDLAKFIWP